MTNSIKIVRHQNLLENLVVVDGMSTAGKSMIAPIISSFERSELWRVNYLNDYIPTINALDRMDRDVASTLLNMMADVDIYNLMISRDTNFRSTDDSSAQKNMLFDRYHDRLSAKDGEEAKDKILRDKPIHTIMVHYLFGNSEILFSAFGKKLKLYIIMVRHPLWLVENWYNAAWHDRIGRDEREFQICCDVEGKVVPWFAVKYADEYMQLPPLAKTIKVLSALLDGFYDQYEKLSDEDKSKVMFIPFELVATDPWPFLNRIMASLCTKTTFKTNEIMEKMDLPRKLDKGEFETKKVEFEKLAMRENLTESSVRLMKKLCSDYEQKFLAGWYNSNSEREQE